MNSINTTDFTISSVFAKANHELRSALTLIYSSLQLIESRHPEVRTFCHWRQVMNDLTNVNHTLNDLSAYIHSIYPYELLSAQYTDTDEEVRPPAASNPAVSFDSEQNLKKEYCDLYELTNSVRESFAAEASEKQISIAIHVEPAAVPALQSFYCDPVRIRRILINLIKNALEAARKESEITVCFSLFRVNKNEDNPRLSLKISNTGSHIAPESLPYIFEPFYTTKKSGNGLGLSIVQELVALHGGTITVTSNFDSTTFHILLPFD